MQEPTRHSFATRHRPRRGGERLQSVKGQERPYNLLG
jgi:hypothetical protein